MYFAIIIENSNLAIEEKNITWNSNITVHHTSCRKIGKIVLVGYNFTTKTAFSANSQIATMPYNASLWSICPIISALSSVAPNRGYIRANENKLCTELAMNTNTQYAGQFIYFTS